MDYVHVIPCTAQKLDHECSALEMYSPSTLFKFAVELTNKIARDAPVYIVSAKYGLVSATQKIEPYDMYLTNQPMAYKRAWGKKVAEELNALNRHLLLQVSNGYWKYIQPHITVPYSWAIEPVSIGRKLKAYKDALRD